MAKNKKLTKAQEYRKMSEQELLNNISETAQRLKKMEFSHAITPINNPMSIRTTRREIAQMQTELNRKKLGF